MRIAPDMSEEMAEISRLLKAGLGLSESPVQITYTDAEPSAIAELTDAVPSGCTYWGIGADRPFYARLEGHLNCEIGAFVMGVAPEGELKDRLFGTVGWMEGEGYLAQGEAMSIPRRGSAAKFVCYGPLGSLPLRPDVVVMFTDPSAAMVALEGASYGKAHPFSVPVTGRPACAIIPYLMNGSDKVAMSMGCTGFRTYVDLAKGKILFAIRGDGLEEYANTLRKVVAANRSVLEEDANRKSRFESGR